MSRCLGNLKAVHTWQNSYDLNSSNMNDDLQQLFFCLCCVVIFNISVIRLLVVRRFCLMARGFLGGKFVGGETP